MIVFIEDQIVVDLLLSVRKFNLVNSGCMMNQISWLLRYLKIAIFSSVLYIPVLACAENDLILVNVNDAAMTMDLLKYLKEHNISFTQKNEKMILVSKKNIEKVSGFLNEISEAVLPVGRHASFEKEAHDNIIKLLIEEEINYKIVQVYGSDWIVWDELDGLRVNEMINESDKRKAKLLETETNLVREQ